MKIIYVHHAERNVGKYHNDKELRQLEDITENGIKDAELVAELFKNAKVRAVYSSPYLRCMHTANIINKYIKAPIFEENRFNEMSGEETWVKFLKRNMSAIDDIVKKYGEDDIIICVTSGVNFSAFVCYFYEITPTSKTTWSQGINCSPINFYINTKKID